MPVGLSHSRSPTELVDLPHYQHPPLVEVVLGVRWRLQGEFPPGIQPRLLERLGPSWELAQPACGQPANSEEDPARPAAPLLFQSLLRDQRLEISTEGLSYAWDGRHGNIYPHYETVRDGFIIALDVWQDASANLCLVPPTFTTWHIAYLNCIPQGTVWNDLSDCTFLRLLATVPPGLPPLEHCAAQWRFALPHYAAHLMCQFHTTPGTPHDDRAQIWLQLSCTGSLSQDPSTLLEGLDYGRQHIVQAFRQLMSPAANSYWELTQDT